MELLPPSKTENGLTENFRHSTQSCWLLLMCVTFLIALPSTLAAQNATPATQPALALDVSAAGDLRINLGDKLVCSGKWVLMSEGWPTPAAGEVSPGGVVSSSVARTDANHLTVTDNYATAKVVCQISLEGEDLSLRAHVQNLDAAHAMKRVGLRGLTFHFAKPPAGTIACWHWSFLAAHGDGIFYPGTMQPIGAVHAHDDQFGFCVFSPSESGRVSLFNANWQADGVIPQQCNIDFYTTRAVPAGQAVDVETRFRISSDFSIPHLFEGYKKVYSAAFPKLLYEPDSRPVGQFAAADKEHITATNPLGYNGEFRRLDTDKGTRTYVASIAPWLYKAEAVGIIFWSPGGFDPPMYPPDFDVLPASVQKNIPKLVEGFKSYDLRVGLCARCGDGVKREDGKEPALYRLNANNPDDMATLMDRFDHSIQMGFDMYYLDSFGSEGLNDLEILKKVRTKVGPKVLLYTEFCTDQSLAYAGHYCEWDGKGIGWTTPDQYAVMRFVQPDSTWLCKSKVAGVVNPPEFAKLGLVSLAEDYTARSLPSKRAFK